MEIRYLKHNAIDKNQWDRCITAAPNGLPYGYSWYLDNVASHWDGLVIDDYQAVFPLPWNRKLLGLRQVYQPFFTQQLGLFSQVPILPRIVERTLNSIPRHFRKVYLHLHEDHPSVGEKRINMVLDLNRPYELIREGYNKSLRKRTRKARSIHQLVSDPIPPADLAHLYQEELGPKTGLKSKHFTVVDNLMQAAIKRKKGKIWGATNQAGELCVAGFFLTSHDRIINLFGASTEQGKELYSMHFLLDALIEKYADQALLFDFEGSSVPGVATFFRQFGPETVNYFQYERHSAASKFLKRH